MGSEGLGTNAIFLFKISIRIYQLYHVELNQMFQVHICSPKPSLHPTLWLRLRAVVPETAWLCLVVPESTRLQYLQVQQLSFLFHSFMFLVIIHKIVMKLSNTDVG